MNSNLEIFHTRENMCFGKCTDLTSSLVLLGGRFLILMEGTVPIRLQSIYNSCLVICYTLGDIVLATAISWLEYGQGKTC